MYKVRVNNQTITITGGSNITTIDSTNVYQCEFIFDSSWNGLTCTACFKNSNLLEESQIILNDTYTCTIPQSVVSVSGNLYVGVLGTNAVNGNVVKPTVWERLAIVIQGVSPTGQIQEDNPTAIGQLISISNQALETANEALDKVNEFDPEVLDGLPTRVAKLETNAIRNNADIIELNNIKLDKSSIVQEIGNSEELIMSQKAVTDALTKAGPQVEAMPEVTSVPDGTIVQYVGADGNTYKKGHWYQSITNTGSETYIQWYDLGITRIVVDTPSGFAKYEPNADEAGLYPEGMVMEYVGRDGQFNGIEVKKGYHYYFYYGNGASNLAQVEPDVKTLPSLEGYTFTRSIDGSGHITDSTDLRNYLKDTIFTYIGENTPSLTRGYHYYATPNMTDYQIVPNTTFQFSYVWAQVEEYYPSYEVLPNYYPVNDGTSPQDEHFAIVRDRNTGKESRALWTGKYSSIGNNSWHLDKVEIATSSRMRELVGLVIDNGIGARDLPTPEGIDVDTVITYTGADNGYWRNGYHYKVEADSNNYTRLVQEETDYYGFDGLNINSPLDGGYIFKSPVTLMVTPGGGTLINYGIPGVEYASVQHYDINGLVPIVSRQTKVVTVNDLSGYSDSDMNEALLSLNDGVELKDQQMTRVMIFNLSDFSYYRILYTLNEIGQGEYRFVKVS